MKGAAPATMLGTSSATDTFKTVFYTKYQPSFQYKHFNEEFITELVSQMENITVMYVAAKGEADRAKEA